MSTSTENDSNNTGTTTVEESGIATTATEQPAPASRNAVLMRSFFPPAWLLRNHNNAQHRTMLHTVFHAPHIPTPSSTTTEDDEQNIAPSVINSRFAVLRQASVWTVILNLFQPLFSSSVMQGVTMFAFLHLFMPYLCFEADRTRSGHLLTMYATFCIVFATMDSIYAIVYKVHVEDIMNRDDLPLEVKQSVWFDSISFAVMAVVIILSYLNSAYQARKLLQHRNSWEGGSPLGMGDEEAMMDQAIQDFAMRHGRRHDDDNELDATATVMIPPRSSCSGMNEDEIAGLMQPSFRHDASVVTKDAPSFMTSCCVCQEDYVANDCCLQLPCTHVFHEACIVSWLKRASTCPVCNANMRERFDMV